MTSSPLWHPFTQEKTEPPPIHIVSARGSRLFDRSGKEYLDMISSWWVTTHGHTHPTIAAAVARQAANLEHVIFAGFSHPPAFELANKLVAITSIGFTKVFFSDSGSSAVESAIKMAVQYWKNRGVAGKTGFIAWEGGYHGDTFGAMSAGKGSAFFSHFHELLFPVFHVPYPATWEGDDEADAKEFEALATLENLLREHGSGIAACIIEPLIQGAGGMRVARPSFLERALTLVKGYDILVILDEVMTGFGRTGTMFAMQQVCVPEDTIDIVCLAKGLTGGFLPLAATMVRQHVYDSFLGDGFETAFIHGHSYTANPLGCAAACAALSLFEEEDTFSRIRRINEIHHEEMLNLLGAFPDLVHRPRILGSISACTIKADASGYTAPVGQQVKAHCIKEGVLLRPLGTELYLMPPYCTKEDELRFTYSVIRTALQKILSRC